MPLPTVQLQKVLITQFCIAIYGGETDRTGRGFDGDCGKNRLISAVHRDQRRMLSTFEWGTNVCFSTDLKKLRAIHNQHIVRSAYDHRSIRT